MEYTTLDDLTSEEENLDKIWKHYSLLEKTWLHAERLAIVIWDISVLLT